MKEINNNLPKDKTDNKNLSLFLNEYIIPKRLIYANTFLQSLKDKKYNWEIHGKKV